MKIARAIVGAISLVAAASQPALAQDLGPGLAVFAGTREATQVSPDLYYTAVAVDFSDYQIPTDGNGRDIGKALLNALGLKKSTKSITIAITFTSSDGVTSTTLPEQAILTYTFDDKRNVTVAVTPAVFSPLWRLEPNEKITATLNYRYSEGSTYDITKAATAMSAVIPSSAIVSTVTSPFFSAVTDFASNILSAADRKPTGTNTAVAMSPYGDSPAFRGGIFTLRLPDGPQLAKVKLSLTATATLLRPVRSVGQASSMDFKLRRPSESIAILMLTTTPGTQKNVLNELIVTGAWGALKSHGETDITKFCSDARTKLRDAYKLTVFDRTLLVYEAMRRAGYGLDNSAWFATCFPDEAERNAVVTATGIAFAPPPPPVTIDSTKWGDDPKTAAAWKNAMGCWMTQQTGKYCTLAAPTPKETLTAAMAPAVSLGALDLPDLDLTSLPSRASATPDAILTLLKGKVALFKCFTPGLILIDATRTHAYTMLAEVRDKKITGLQIQAANADMLDCVS